MHPQRVGTQVTTIKKAAASKAEEEVDKVENAVADKDNDKLTSSKPRQPVHCSKKKKKLPKRTEPLDDNLDDYFSPSQSQNSQETADVMLVNTPKKSGEAKSKNDPDGSSCQRVDN